MSSIVCFSCICVRLRSLVYLITNPNIQSKVFLKILVTEIFVFVRKIVASVSFFPGSPKMALMFSFLCPFVLFLLHFIPFCINHVVILVLLIACQEPKSYLKHVQYLLFGVIQQEAMFTIFYTQCDCRNLSLVKMSFFLPHKQNELLKIYIYNAFHILKWAPVIGLFQKFNCFTFSIFSRIN